MDHAGFFFFCFGPHFVVSGPFILDYFAKVLLMVAEGPRAVMTECCVRPRIGYLFHC